jgi:hypothetical protein
VACKQLVKNFFDGRKNLLLKGNAEVCTGLGIATDMDLDAKKIAKKEKRIF